MKHKQSLRSSSIKLTVGLKPKAVFDTNIFVSGIIFGGNPRTSLELARAGEINLFTSKSLLFELSQKLKKKFRWRDNEIKDVIEGIGKYVTVVEPSKEVTIIKSDPSDNKVLECALESKVEFIVSGDKRHLLSLGKFKNIPIVSAKEFLDLYYGKKK